MAIALESDFRSPKTGLAPESADRKALRPGLGEEFAKRLRDPSAATDSDSAATTPNPISLPLAAAFETSPTDPAKLPDIAALNAKSEIVIDRALIRSESDAVAADLPDQLATPSTDAVPAAISAVALAPEVQIPGLPVELPAPVPAAELTFAESAAAAELQANTNDPANAGPAPLSDQQIAAASGDANADSASTGVAVAAGAPASVAVSNSQEASKTTSSPERGAPVSGARPTAGKASAKSDATAPTEQVATNGQGAIAPEAMVTSAAGKGASASASDGSDNAVQGLSALASSASGPAAPQASTPAPAPLPMTPTQGILTASPAQLVDIISQSAEDGQSDRVVVQLDPPELGRVSIDFKFDAQGLQHVTVTAETPDAARQLRIMHTDLVQALERQGLGSENMTFQHNQQNAQQGPAPNPFAKQALIEAASAEVPASPTVSRDNPNSARTPSGARLDIRL